VEEMQQLDQEDYEQQKQDQGCERYGGMWTVRTVRAVTWLSSGGTSTTIPTPKLLRLQLRGQLTFGWLAHLNGCFYISHHFCHLVRSFQFSSDWRTLGCEPYGHTKDGMRVVIHCEGSIQDLCEAWRAFTCCTSLHSCCCCIIWWSGMEVQRWAVSGGLGCRSSSRLHTSSPSHSAESSASCSMQLL
jgi:hypothetical protein